jgi:mRNA interferase YafQ
MRNLVLTPRFKRAFRKFVQRDRALQSQIEQILEELRTDLSAPNLGTHKLVGNLQGLRACSCGYDCRIVFSIEKSKITKEESIILIDIGTHDEVY